MGTASPEMYRYTDFWYSEFPSSTTTSSTRLANSGFATSASSHSYSCLLLWISPNITISCVLKASRTAAVAPLVLGFVCAKQSELNMSNSADNVCMECKFTLACTSDNRLIARDYE